MPGAIRPQRQVAADQAAMLAPATRSRRRACCDPTWRQRRSAPHAGKTGRATARTVTAIHSRASCAPRDK
ncbi:hypothetical protein GSH08_32675 [Burkholderia pseudomallei]|nr:hypothetical protein [Burkholderia pseudomallei]MBM5588777.1 hypothetical protein [Burkholderia pseudomallei]RPA01430.1 hypothetical protein EGT86_33560 [Burkholderia pseudomallei]